MSDARSVIVHLLDKEYRVACPPGERENLIKAAHFLDEKLHKVRDAGIVGFERIAIMTALNLAHEYLQNRHQASSTEIAQLIEKIDAELAAEEVSN